jgi:hypothetical protein
MNTIRRAASRMANRRQAGGLVADLADFVRTLTAAFDPYRPELHYMRGPGPKWHAKHNPASAASVGEPIPALVRVRARAR